MFWNRQRHEPVAQDDGEADRELEDAFASDSGPTSNADRPYDAVDSTPASQPTSTSSERQRIPGAYDFEANPAETRITEVESEAVPPHRSLPISAVASFRERIATTLFGRGYGRISNGDHFQGRGTDAVFTNLNAKPERGQAEDWVGGDDENGSKEAPPSYEAAAADATPPYWETTIIAPTGFYGPDEILVEGLPIGNLFAFAWNMLVSSSFQFVGFLLTYLLHTTHAAKHGSRAGLGITLIQYSFYLKTKASALETELQNDEIPPDLVGVFPNANDTNLRQDRWGIWGQPIDDTDDSSNNIAAGLFGTPASASASASAASVPTAISALSEQQREGLEEAMKMSSIANDWLSYILMAIGWALLVGAIFSYYKAWRYARAIRAENDANNSTSATSQTNAPTISVVVA